MNINELKLMQQLPLYLKIAKTEQRLTDAVNLFGQEGLYFSFSGGKDSSVLIDIGKRMYPGIPVVMCDTGLEYPELVKLAMPKCDVVLKPKMNFIDVITKYGYPCVSKEQSQFIYQYRTAKSKKTKDTRLNGNKWGQGKISKKHLYLIDSDIPISDKCCDVMKKAPFKIYEKETGRIPILGKMACESSKRMQDYIKQGGCNAFNNKRQKSEPVGFWTEQDMLYYILKYNVEIPSVYGEIITENGLFKTTKCDRTGCMFCLYGIHMDGEINRIQRMKETHNNIYNYCIRGGQHNEKGMWIPKDGLGMGHVLDVLKQKY